MELLAAKWLPMAGASPRPASLAHLSLGASRARPSHRDLRLRRPGGARPVALRHRLGRRLRHRLGCRHGRLGPGKGLHLLGDHLAQSKQVEAWPHLVLSIMWPDRAPLQLRQHLQLTRP